MHSLPTDCSYLERLSRAILALPQTLLNNRRNAKGSIPLHDEARQSAQTLASVDRMVPRPDQRPAVREEAVACEHHQKRQRWMEQSAILLLFPSFLGRRISSLFRFTRVQNHVRLLLRCSSHPSHNALLILHLNWHVFDSPSPSSVDSNLSPSSSPLLCTLV